MGELTQQQKEEIIRRRECKSDKDEKKYPINQLEIHYKDRNPKHNEPENLRVLTKKQHDELHKRAGR